MSLAWNGPTVHHSPIGLPVCTKHTAADLFASSLLFQHPRNNSSVDCWTISAHICFLPCSLEVAASKPTLDWLTVSSFPLTWWHFNAFYASLDWDTRVKEPKNYSLFFCWPACFRTSRAIISDFVGPCLATACTGVAMGMSRWMYRWLDAL